MSNMESYETSNTHSNFHAEDERQINRAITIIEGFISIARRHRDFVVTRDVCVCACATIYPIFLNYPAYLMRQT